MKPMMTISAHFSRWKNLTMYFLLMNFRMGNLFSGSLITLYSHIIDNVIIKAFQFIYLNNEKVSTKHYSNRTKIVYNVMS